MAISEACAASSTTTMSKDEQFDLSNTERRLELRVVNKISASLRYKISNWRFASERFIRLEKYS